MSEKNIYFDTNVYNLLLDNYSSRDLEAFSKALLLSGNKLYLSPINVLEFFQNNDALRREKLIYLCQQICQPNLLVEPEALIIDFIVQSTNDTSVIHLSLSNFISTSVWGAAWRSIKSNRLKTFVFKAEDVEKFGILKDMYSYFHAHYSRGGSFRDLWEDKNSPLLSLPDFLKSSAVEKRSRPVSKERDINIKEHVWILITQILCVGCTLFPEAIDEYWNSLNIHGSEARIKFAFNELKFLNDSGPLLGMGALMAWQATKKYNQGNLFDCYHLLYITYIDIFVTGDDAFHGLKSTFNKSEILKKIYNFDSFLALA